MKETYKSKFDNHFKERFKQYIVDCKGDDSKDLKDFDKIFETLIINIKSKPNYKKELESTTYLTAFKELMLSKATSISVALANKAFSYSLTLKDVIEPTLATNPFTYTLNTFSS